MGEIINLLSGQDLNSKEYNDIRKGIPYITGASNFSKNKLEINRWTEFEKNIAKKGDILITCKGTIGEMTILEIDRVHIARQLMSIDTIINNQKYILYFLTFKLKEIQQKANGLIPGINREDILLQIIPLPPLSEQRRIVEKIEELLALLDGLETNKTDLQSYIKQAKSKVLEMAVRGELVPQNPDDEPASVLLERIKKEQKSSKSKGKNTEHNTHYEEELPFDIPENWVWCRLGEVCEKIETGNSINAKIKETKYKNLEEGFPYIGTKDISENHYIKYDNGIKIPFLEKFKIAKKNSVLLCIEGGSAGRKIGITNRDVCFGNKLAKFYSHNISNSYILFFLMSEQFKSQFKESISGLIGGVSVNKLGQFVLPLPPLAEQKRIVEKIGEIFSALEFIEESLI